MTSPKRPPSCDLLKPKLKECPACANDYLRRDGCWVKCRKCGIDLHWSIWNSIPRRSEVAELLRLVDETIISPPTPAEGRLLQYAAKLRKEWNL